MSHDGPHRSLHLPRQWVRVARSLENPTTDDAEVLESFTACLRSDISREINPRLLRSIRGLLENDQHDLLDGSAASRAAAAHALVVGKPFAEILLRLASFPPGSSASTEEALIELLENSIREYTQGITQEMMENCLRDALFPARKRRKFLNRLEKSCHEIRFDLLARDASAAKPVAKARVRRGTDLDDGPPIN
jgi:hypothetical protein